MKKEPATNNITPKKAVKLILFKFSMSSLQLVIILDIQPENIMTKSTRARKYITFPTSKRTCNLKSIEFIQLTKDNAKVPITTENHSEPNFI
jgi:hypothetical protein